MKRIHAATMAAMCLFLMVLTTACTGFSSFQEIVAEDRYAGESLSLSVRSKYSPGDKGLGGCSFESDKDFEELVEVAQNTAQVASVDARGKSRAAVYVSSGDGFAAYFLAEGLFYGMNCELVYGDKANTEQFDFQFPYHLVEDHYLQPGVVYAQALNGAEYRCTVDTDDIVADFKAFYDMTGHYELRPEEDGFVLVVPEGEIRFRFVDHAGETFVSLTLESPREMSAVREHLLPGKGGTV